VGARVGDRWTAPGPDPRAGRGPEGGETWWGDWDVLMKTRWTGQWDAPPPPRLPWHRASALGASG